MNTKYLGDAFDHWKGSIISLLVNKSLLRDIIIEPLITDLSPWNTDERETYRRLLQLKPIDIVTHADSTFTGDRDEYFAGIPEVGDLFIDPDTGIATGKASRQHVKISEIATLCDKSDRVLLIYQHSARGEFHERLLEISSKIYQEIPTSHVMFYKCGFVALVIVSNDSQRIENIHTVLKEHLKGTADKRIIKITR